MFSLRQIFCAGFGGVFPGCLLLACNFVFLPYRRGAAIGILFGSLTQVVMMLLYLMFFSGISTALDDVLLKENQTRFAILAAILLLQLISAFGCMQMGKYFLCPASDVTTFDRAALEERIRTLDQGKRSVVHDIVLEFEQNPAVPAKHQSWGYVFGAVALNVFVLFLWIRAVIHAFYPLWFDNRTMDALWAWDLFVELFWPWLVMTLFGYLILGWFAFKRAPKAKKS